MKALMGVSLAVLVSSAGFAHEVKPGEKIQNYVTHAEVDDAVQVAIDQKKLAEAKVQEELAEKKREDIRRERFFNRSSRER